MLGVGVRLGIGVKLGIGVLVGTFGTYRGLPARMVVDDPMQLAF